MSTSDITFLTARALWKPGLIEEITRDEWKSNTAREFSATNSIFQRLDRIAPRARFVETTLYPGQSKKSGLENMPSEEYVKDRAEYVISGHSTTDCILS